MNEDNSRVGFWQFPLALKFVVFWLVVMGLLQASGITKEINQFQNDDKFSIGHLVSMILQFVLAGGLIRKRNSARIWTSVFMGISMVALAFFLEWVFFEAPPDASFGYIIFGYDIPTSRIQLGGFYLLFFIFNTIILYILQRPSTKALFSHSPAPSSESAPQESQ